MDGTAEDERQRQRHRHGTVMNSSCGTMLVATSVASNGDQVVKKGYENCNGGKVYDGVIRGHEAEQLNKRLYILEEETKTMKQAFFETVEERQELVNEVYRQFCLIGHYLRLQNKLEVGPAVDDNLVTDIPSKDGRQRNGLREIIGKEANSSLVIKDLKAKALAFQEKW